MLAKKSLGQHFLRSERALVAIVEAGELSSQDTVLEIGPGQGALTERLLATGCHLLAVEKDDALYKLLKEKFAQEIASGQLELINGDILDFDPSSYGLEAGSYKLIANIPYNITGAILEKFLSHQAQPSLAVLLVQDEVAKRVVARNNKESILSLSVKAYGTPRYVDKVLAGSFAPAPEVDSAVLSISNISKQFFTNFSEEWFFTLIKAGFKSKRKKLSSNLSSVVSKSRVEKAFNTLSLDPNTRAEDLTLTNWQRLAQQLQNAS